LLVLAPLWCKQNSGRVLYRTGCVSPILSHSVAEVHFVNEVDAVQKLGDPDLVFNYGKVRLLVWNYQESYASIFKNVWHRQMRVYLYVDEHGKAETRIFHAKGGLKNAICIRSGLKNQVKSTGVSPRRFTLIKKSV